MVATRPDSSASPYPAGAVTASPRRRAGTRPLVARPTRRTDTPRHAVPKPSSDVARRRKAPISPVSPLPHTSHGPPPPLRGRIADGRGAAIPPREGRAETGASAPAGVGRKHRACTRDAGRPPHPARACRRESPSPRGEGWRASKMSVSILFLTIVLQDASLSPSRPAEGHLRRCLVVGRHRAVRGPAQKAGTSSGGGSK